MKIMALPTLLGAALTFFTGGPATAAPAAPVQTAVQAAVCTVVTDTDPAVGEYAAVNFDFTAVDYSSVEGETVYLYAGDRYVSQAKPRTGDSVSIEIPDDSVDAGGNVDLRLVTSDDYTPYGCTTTQTTDTAPLCVVTTDATPAPGEHAYVDFDFSDPRLAPTEGGFAYIFGGDTYAAHDYPEDGDRIPISLPVSAFESGDSIDIRVQTSNPWVWTSCVVAIAEDAPPLCVVTTDSTPADGEAAIVTYDFSNSLFATSENETTYVYSVDTYAAWSTASTGSSVAFRIPDGAVEPDGSVTFRAKTADPVAWRDCVVEQRDWAPLCTATTDVDPEGGERAVIRFDFSDERFEATPGQVAYIYGGDDYAGYVYPGDGSEVTVAMPAGAIGTDGSVDIRVLLSDHWAWSSCAAETTVPTQLCVVTAGDDPQPGDTVSVRYDFSDRFYASSDQGSAYLFSRDIYLKASRPTTGSVVEVELPEGAVNRDGSVAIRVRTSTPVAFTDCYSPATREVEPLPATTTTATPSTTPSTAASTDSSTADSSTEDSATDESSTSTTTADESTTTTAATGDESAAGTGDQDDTSYRIEDAGLGQGATCQATTSEDMLPRRTIAATEVTTATQAYTSSFSTDDGMFRILSGSWSVTDGQYKQLNTCGFDYTALLRTAALENYRFEASFAGQGGPNHGGVIIGQAGEETRSGAVLVDLADSGNRIRWGYYDDAGYYRNIGSVEIDGPGPGQWVKLEVEVVDGVVDVGFNGLDIVSFEHGTTSGHVGLVASTAVVAFDDVTLTALPSGG